MNQLIGFWKSFFFIFLLGNILMGVFEIFTYVNIYPYIKNSINLSSMEKRFLILFPFLKYFIVLSYAIYSFYLMYQYIDIIQHKLFLKFFLLFYYIFFVFILTYVQYCTPLSYLTSCFYTGIRYGKFVDIKTFMWKHYRNQPYEDIN